MKLSAKLSAAFVAVSAFVMTADGAVAAVNNTTTRSNTQHNVTDQITCPVSDVASTNTATGKQTCGKDATGINDSKNVNDGAAKGEASEGTYRPTGGTTNHEGRRVGKRVQEKFGITERMNNVARQAE